MSDADREKAFAKQLEGALKDLSPHESSFPRNRIPSRTLAAYAAPASSFRVALPTNRGICFFAQT